MSEPTSNGGRKTPNLEPQPRGAHARSGRPIDQAEAAERFLAATSHQKQHDERLWTLRQRRDEQMWSIPEWEEMRSLASAIKEHTLSRLDTYLEMFEAKAKANGVVVHWAKDAAEHNEIVQDILEDHGSRTLIKSKSMLTEECGFRAAMARAGIEVTENRSRRAYPATRQRGPEPRRRACRAQIAG
jgi:L-lactate dehydrogenase complex protein LldF